MRHQTGVSITEKRLAGKHTVLVQEGASIPLPEVLQPIPRLNRGKLGRQPSQAGTIRLGKENPPLLSSGIVSIYIRSPAAKTPSGCYRVITNANLESSCHAHGGGCAYDCSSGRDSPAVGYKGQS